MLKGTDNSKQISSHPPIFRNLNLPGWENTMLHEQGFTELNFNKLTRKGSDKNEYLVYSNKDEFKAVEAETATLAIDASATPSPHKIIHSYCRLDDIIPLEKLEFVEMNVEHDVNIQETAQAGDSSAAASPAPAKGQQPAEEPKPEENKS